MEREVWIHKIRARGSHTIGHKVPEISRMSPQRVRPAMRHPGGIEMRARRGRVRSGAIARLVKMEAMFSWCQAVHIRLDPHSAFHFGKRDRPPDFVSLGGIQLSHSALPGFSARATGKRQQSQHQHSISQFHNAGMLRIPEEFAIRKTALS